MENHLPAIYGDYAGSFSLETGDILAGEMPPRQSKKIKDFIDANRSELMEKWNELKK